MEIYFFANSGNFHKFQQPDQPSVIWDSLVRIVSRQRSVLHEYSSVRIRRFDSWMKNRARAYGCSESRGEDLGMNYSSDALQISLGKDCRYDVVSRTKDEGGTKSAASRRIISEKADAR